MVKKCVSKILLSSLLLCSVLYLFVQCIKDDSFSKAQIEQMKQAEELIAKNVNHGSNGIFTLPVNLHKYNRNPQTKGSQTDTTYNIIVDSLIDHTKGRTQLYDNGWIYYQVPFKSNEVGIYAAIMPKSGNFADSLVRIKCYYLLVNKYRETDKMEYSVTMIPTHSYQKQNPDYDFLDKPSFSGYILYSLTDGTFVRGEAYKNGVIQDGMLKTTDNTDTQTKSTAKNNNNSDGSSDSGGTNTGTTDKDEPEQLNSVFCIAERIDSAPHLPADFFNPKVYVEFDPKKTIDIGNGGGGGNPDTRSAETQYTVTCTIDNCDSKDVDNVKVTKGSVFTRTAPSNKDKCKFVAWIGSIKEACSLDRTISFTVKKNISVTAKFASPTKDSVCYKLMEFLGAGARPTTLKALINNFSNAREMAVTSTSIGIDSVFKGTAKNVKIKYHRGTTYYGTAHSHLGGRAIPSSTDVVHYFYNRYSFADFMNYPFDILGFIGNNEYNMISIRYSDTMIVYNLLENLMESGMSKNGAFNALRDIIKQRLKETLDDVMEDYFKNLVESPDWNYLYGIVDTALKEFGLTYNLTTLVKVSDDCLQIRWNDYDPEVSQDEKHLSKECFTQINS